VRPGVSFHTIPPFALFGLTIWCSMKREMNLKACRRDRGTLGAQESGHITSVHQGRQKITLGKMNPVSYYAIAVGGAAGPSLLGNAVRYKKIASALLPSLL
jgi:hypothetical protein